MTEGYKIFEKQYYATGREKLDGYTLENLNYITDEEKEDVLKKLVAEVSDFYGAVEPLLYLDSSLAVTTFKKIISAQPIEKVRKAYPIFFALWNATQDKEHLYGFIACRDYISDLSKLDFYSLAASQMEVKEIYEMVAAAIFEETDDMSRGVAAEAILNKFNIPFEGKTKDQHKNYWKILKFGRVDEKKELLTQLQKVG